MKTKPLTRRLMPIIVVICIIISIMSFPASAYTIPDNMMTITHGDNVFKLPYIGYFDPEECLIVVTVYNELEVYIAPKWIDAVSFNVRYGSNAAARSWYIHIQDLSVTNSRNYGYYKLHYRDLSYDQSSLYSSGIGNFGFTLLNPDGSVGTVAKIAGSLFIDRVVFSNCDIYDNSVSATNIIYPADTDYIIENENTPSGGVDLSAITPYVQYITAILAFFVIVLICYGCYKFFNMFF